MEESTLPQNGITKHFQIENIDWYVYRRMLMPIPGPHVELKINLKKIRNVVMKNNLIGATWNYDWDCVETPWYWIVCTDREYDLHRLGSYVRRDVRRGLKRNEIKPVTLEWIAEHGYDVYCKAFERYKFMKPQDESGFRRELLKLVDVSKPEGWAVFNEGKLIAWLSAYINGDAVFAHDLKFDPSYRKAYPTNAIFYVITRHYIVENNYRYITAGQRNVNHHTHVQDFLVKHMAWRKAYTRLALWLRPEIRLPLSWGLGKFSRYLDKFHALTTLSRNIETASLLWQIAQACNSGKNPKHLQGNLGVAME